MDTNRFDRITRTVSLVLSRRGLAGALGLAALGIPRLTIAQKKKKKKKIKRNAFGCVDVGKFCTNSGQCCSGICQGKKGKKTCQAHDTGGCTPDQDVCSVDESVPCTTATDNDGVCFKTTGNAGYCSLGGLCFSCTRDADCQSVCGPLAACAVCLSDCEEEGNTVCVGPDECAPPPD